MESEITDWPKVYETHLKLPRSEISLYELEHPQYDTEEQFISIMCIWERERSNWSMMWREGCPRPKRRAGRPRDAAALAEKQALEKARAERQAERQAERPKSKPKAKTQRVGIYVALPDELAAGLFAVRGDLPLDECIRQLLALALGPLAQQKTGAP